MPPRVAISSEAIGKPPKLEIRSVGKTFVIAGQSAEVLKDVSLTVAEGEFVSIVGPSGSGKSTLFHMIGGLTEPTAGDIVLDGKRTNGQRGLISYMPQHDSLLPWRTILDNVILSQELAGIPKAGAKEQAAGWLERVGLKGYEHAYPHQLSGGMKQRASFLRALLSPRELMCLDEPFGALDALTRLDMQQWLLRIWEETRRSVLFVTHSIEEALLLSDRVYVLSGKPAAVSEEIVVPFGRPRGESITSQREFLELKRQIYDSLRSIL